MFRYRKLWMTIAAFVIVLVLIGTFIKPDLVTVVPNEHQLNQEDSDLHIPDQSNKVLKDSVKKVAPSEPDSLQDTLQSRD
jgi:hypothetical protein